MSCDLKIVFSPYKIDSPLFLLIKFSLDLRKISQYARVPAQYREVTLSLSFSFFVFHCVESCFLFVSFKRDFIVGALRLSSVLKNFPVFAKRMANRTQPHITRLEDRERNVKGKMGWRYKASEWKGTRRRVYLVQLSVRDGGFFILLIYVSLSLPYNFAKRIYIYKHALLHYSLNIIFNDVATWLIFLRDIFCG